MLPLERFRGNRYFKMPAGKILHVSEHAEVPRSWDEEKREFGKNSPSAEVLRSGKEREASGHTF